MKIAVVHDYFTQMGGAEKVAAEMYAMLDEASLFTTVALPQCMPPLVQNIPVHTSWMQKLPLIEKYYRLYFMLYPMGVSSLDLSGYDLVLSSSSGYAKGVQTDRDAMHVCYCHTPTRWVWNYDNYSKRESFSSLQRTVLSQLIKVLKHWDKDAARQPDHFVANSQVVADRIKAAYGRSAEVIHPPIDIDRFRASDEQEDYYVVLSRLVPYKRIDLAVKACTQLGKKLLVIGDGTNRRELERLAGSTIKFLGRASDETVEYHVSRCKALLFPGEEDFGMAPLEVASAGRPTIAYRAGGAQETVVENVTGLFFDQQTSASLEDAILRFERQDWSPVELRRHSENFRVEVFQEKFSSFLNRIGAPARMKNVPAHFRLALDIMESVKA
jgi:glycosyltransferase involved in cell wall biosynthesis